MKYYAHNYVHAVLIQNEKQNEFLSSYRFSIRKLEKFTSCTQIHFLHFLFSRPKLTIGFAAFINCRREKMKDYFAAKQIKNRKYTHTLTTPLRVCSMHEKRE